MWQKIKCWLGFHEWLYTCKLINCVEGKFHCESCKHSYMVCDHCRKVKR